MNNFYVKSLEAAWATVDFNYVKVNEHKMEDLIHALKTEEPKIPVWSLPHINPAVDCGVLEWINFVCWTMTAHFSCINFHYPYRRFTVEYPQGIFWEGIFAIQASFMRAFQEGIPVFDAKFMAKITQSDVAYIFRPAASDCGIPMEKEREAIFQEVGSVLIKKYHGSWAPFFYESNWRTFHRGEGIVERLVAEFPSFRDTRVYKDRFLEFHTKAQFLVLMYHGRAVVTGKMPPLRDMENIGPLAEYETQKALRAFGVLEYAENMERGDGYKVFPQGHPFEVENRLATSYVLKRVCDAAGCSMAHANYYLWLKGIVSKIPHILIPTTDY